ncbi:MAG: FGGY-family carbohydrate kinase, partial [Anaerolineae bacterium]
MPYFLAIDAGTTSTKVILFDGGGNPVATSIQEYRLSTPAPDWVELEAQQYWWACVEGIRQVLSKSSVHPQTIAALSVSSQGETIIAVDEQGMPLRPAIVWLDNRAKGQAQHLAENFDLDVFYRITGLPEVIPTWPACKILWLKDQEPAVFARAQKYLLLEDYLLYRFSGNYATEGSVSTTTGYFDIRSGQWWPEMLTFLGISAEALPVLYRSGEAIGYVTPEAARETGLSTRTQVVTGAMDQVAAAVGSGNIAPGRVTETTGTALVLAATVEQPTYDPQKRFPCYYHALPGRYLLLPYCQTAGMVLKWFR